MKQRLGLLILVLGVASCGGGSSGSNTASSGAGMPKQLSTTGNMFPFAPDRAWTYHTVNATGPYTVTLHENTNNASGIDTISAFVVPGIQNDALSGAPAATIAESVALRPTAGSFQVLSVARTRNGAFTIPGSPELVPETLTQGQTYSPYVGVGATVAFIGAVPGAGVCGMSGNGATVQYAFQDQSYAISFLPGCGITDFVTNTGVELRLASIGTFSTTSIAQAERSLAGTTLLDTIRTVTNALFRR